MRERLILCPWRAGCLSSKGWSQEEEPVLLIQLRGQAGPVGPKWSCGLFLEVARGP